jgi:cytochrome c biogenesis protein CcmG/thiol:disulfide interchange protein DsbE
VGVDPLAGEGRPVTGESTDIDTEPTSDRSIDDAAAPSHGVHYRRPFRPLRLAALAVGAVLTGFVFILGTRLGKDPTLVRSPLLGKPAPEFSLPRFDQSGEISSSALSEHIYVVNFWASWCVPCRRETPALAAFYRQWQPRGVELVGILYNDTLEAALAFRKDLGGTWPLVADPGGRTAIDYGVFGVPETFVVDQRGTIMAKFVGAVGPGVLEDTIARLGAGSGPLFSENDQYQRGR